jgi:hypothetical protein
MGLLRLIGLTVRGLAVADQIALGVDASRGGACDDAVDRVRARYGS